MGNKYKGIWYGVQPNEYEEISEYVVATTEDEARRKFFEMYNGNPPYNNLSITKV